MRFQTTVEVLETITMRRSASVAAATILLAVLAVPNARAERVVADWQTNGPFGGNVQAVAFAARKRVMESA